MSAVSTGRVSDHSGCQCRELPPKRSVFVLYDGSSNPRINDLSKQFLEEMRNRAGWENFSVGTGLTALATFGLLGPAGGAVLTVLWATGSYSKSWDISDEQKSAETERAHFLMEESLEKNPRATDDQLKAYVKTKWKDFEVRQIECSNCSD